MHLFLKILDRMANRVDADQQSDQCLVCLCMPILSEQFVYKILEQLLWPKDTAINECKHSPVFENIILMNLPNGLHNNAICWVCN